MKENQKYVHIQYLFINVIQNVPIALLINVGIKIGIILIKKKKKKKQI